MATTVELLDGLQNFLTRTTHSPMATTKIIPLINTGETVSLTTHTHTGYQASSTVLTNTTASFTTALETKLNGVAAGAEVNVQSDWNATSGDAMILNKPTIVDQNSSGILTREIGLQNNIANYFCIATMTVTALAYTGGTVMMEIIGQGQAYYKVMFGGYLNATPSAWDTTTCYCNVFAPWGLEDTDSFTAVINYTAKTFKIYYKHGANAFNMRYLLSTNGFFNGGTMSYTRDAVGVATLPTSDATINTLIYGT